MLADTFIQSRKVIKFYRSSLERVLTKLYEIINSVEKLQEVPISEIQREGHNAWKLIQDIELLLLYFDSYLDDMKKTDYFSIGNRLNKDKKRRIRAFIQDQSDELSAIINATKHNHHRIGILFQRKSVINALDHEFNLISIFLYGWDKRASDFVFVSNLGKRLEFPITVFDLVQTVFFWVKIFDDLIRNFGMDFKDNMKIQTDHVSGVYAFVAKRLFKLLPFISPNRWTHIGFDMIIEAMNSDHICLSEFCIKCIELEQIEIMNVGSGIIAQRKFGNAIFDPKNIPQQKWQLIFPILTKELFQEAIIELKICQTKK